MYRLTYFSLLLALSLSFTNFTTAQDNTPQKPKQAPAKINWMSFEEAYELNKTQPKKIFIDMWTYWCGWCKRMDATTFTNPVVVEYMN